MRRWIAVTVVLLMILALTGALLPLARPAPLPEGTPRMTGLGLVLLENGTSLYVLGVIDGSRASSAGIQPGDRLIAATDTALTTVAQLEALLAAQGESTALPLTLAREDQMMTVQLSLQ